MVYFLPIGGLANRLRSLDSILWWCEEYQRDLTVLWLTNFELNAKWQDLFEPIAHPSVKVQFINCQPDFPRFDLLFTSNKLGYRKNSYTRYLKNLLKGRSLSAEEKGILKQLKGLNDRSILENKIDFAPIYHRLDQHKTEEYRGLDNKIIEQTRPLLQKLFTQNKGPVFVSSCYRIAPLSGGYNYLKPIKRLQEKIDQTTATYGKTFGLHIRRGDHSIAVANSTDRKFYDLIEEQINLDPEVSFFLSTDDPELKERLQLKYENRIVFNKIEVYDRNAPEAIESAVWDFFCLSKTLQIFGSHQSSFSQVAADIGQIKEITVK